MRGRMPWMLLLGLGAGLLLVPAVRRRLGKRAGGSCPGCPRWSGAPSLPMSPSGPWRARPRTSIPERASRSVPPPRHPDAARPRAVRARGSGCPRAARSRGRAGAGGLHRGQGRAGAAEGTEAALSERSRPASRRPGSRHPPRPRRARTSSGPIPSMRTRLFRPCSPEIRAIDRRGRSSVVASSSTIASFAAPSTGGALTRTSSAPSRIAPMPGRDARGLALTSSSTPPGTSRTGSATARLPSSGRGTRRCRPRGPAPRRRAGRLPRSA